MKNGKKFDNGKPDLVGLLSGPEAILYALESMGRVIEFGRAKYGGDNWSQVPNARRRYLAAALRHLSACAREGINALDPESGLPHLAHGLVSGLFVLSMALSDLRGAVKDPSGNGQVRTSAAKKDNPRKHR